MAVRLAPMQTITLLKAKKKFMNASTQTTPTVRLSKRFATLPLAGVVLTEVKLVTQKKDNLFSVSELQTI